MTLVTLLGSELSTLIVMFAEFAPKMSRHILVYDDALYEKKYANRFSQGITSYALRHNLTIDFYEIIIDEDSRLDMLGVIKSVHEMASDEILLHISKGYAATSLLMSNMMLQHNSKILTYDAKEDEYHIYNGLRLEAHKPQKRLSIEEYIELMGYKVHTKPNMKEVKKRRADIFSLFEQGEEFKTVVRYLVKGNTLPSLEGYKRILKTLRKLRIVDANYRLKPKSEVVLTGGLFEEYIFWLCKEHEVDDVALGYVVDFDEGSDEVFINRRIANEFDVLLMENNSLVMIECKYKKQLDGLALVYKYDAILDHFGENVKGVLLNISDKPKIKYLDMKTSDNFSIPSLRRARFSNLHIYHESLLKREHFKSFLSKVLES